MVNAVRLGIDVSAAEYNLGGRPTNETKQASAVVIEKGKKRFSR
jgi:hypothetical protein